MVDNQERAEMVRPHLYAYVEEHYGDCDIESAVADMICNLLHLQDRLSEQALDGRRYAGHRASNLAAAMYDEELHEERVNSED